MCCPTSTYSQLRTAALRAPSKTHRTLMDRFLQLPLCGIFHSQLLSHLPAHHMSHMRCPVCSKAALQHRRTCQSRRKGTMWAPHTDPQSHCPAPNERVREKHSGSDDKKAREACSAPCWFCLQHLGVGSALPPAIVSWIAQLHYDPGSLCLRRICICLTPEVCFGLHFERDCKYIRVYCAAMH